MNVSEALAAWLASASARAATQAAMGRLAAEVAAMPAWVGLKRDLPAAVDAGAQAVLEMARGFIEDDAALAGFMNAAIAAAAADPFCRPPFRASRNEVQEGLVLFSHPALTIQLAMMSADALAIKRCSREGRASIVFTGQRTLFRFLEGGGAILSIWETPFIEAGFSAAAAGRCRLREQRRLADGDAIEFDGRRESFIVDSTGSDLVYVFASTSLEASPVAAEYDSQTLELVAASSTDDTSSRTQMMLALLRTMGRRDAAPLFAERTRAPHFYARWQAMRELLALDAELALPHLRIMAERELHPEVRAAAAETLAAFFDPQTEMELLSCPG